MELKIPESIFNKVQSQAPVNYTIFEIDLSIFRNNQEFCFHGNIFQVLEISENAKFSVKFNNIEHNFIEIDNYATITGLYTKFFISNTIQPNKKLKIFCGNTFYYKPNFKSTFTIIENEIVNISNILPTLSNKLSDLTNAINNMEITLNYQEVVDELKIIQNITTYLQNLVSNIFSEIQNLSRTHLETISGSIPNIINIDSNINVIRYFLENTLTEIQQRLLVIGSTLGDLNNTINIELNSLKNIIINNSDNTNQNLTNIYNNTQNIYQILNENFSTIVTNFSNLLNDTSNIVYYLTNIYYVLVNFHTDTIQNFSIINNTLNNIYNYSYSTSTTHSNIQLALANNVYQLFDTNNLRKKVIIVNNSGENDIFVGSQTMQNYRLTNGSTLVLENYRGALWGRSNSDDRILNIIEFF